MQDYGNPTAFDGTTPTSGGVTLLAGFRTELYTRAETEEGQALQVAAEAAFKTGRKAVSTATASARDEKLAAVREDFTDYRATVQANFSPDVRTALGAGGRLPADLQTFITLARSAYTAARQRPYADVLAKWLASFRKQARTGLRKLPALAAHLGACKPPPPSRPRDDYNPRTLTRRGPT